MKRVLLSVLLCVTASASAQPLRCPPFNQQINDGNNLILIEGTGKGAIRQVVVGTFGKDTDRQARLLGTFDRCGRLRDATFSWQMRDEGIRVEMRTEIAARPDGWQSTYQVVVTAQRGEQTLPVRVKQGYIRWLTGKHGNIVSASDRFMLQGKPGLTTITYGWSPQMRLSRAVARGDDPLNNGVSAWRWNARGQLISSTLVRRESHYYYDAQQRETRMSTVQPDDQGITRSEDRCQLWDEQANCTLTYTVERESLPGRTQSRQLTTAVKYTYWDAPDTAD
ncbi:hypothetical protein [Pantoea sp. 1.19]|uniref:hypothetical protein n=1 Tax=Pantoea sp. 1.19 TaxID=1925589 RepID=UPI00111507CE|nr:hypothetical protein [Pantoea sp. 1.19]